MSDAKDLALKIGTALIEWANGTAVSGSPLPSAPSPIEVVDSPVPPPQVDTTPTPVADTTTPAVEPPPDADEGFGLEAVYIDNPAAGWIYDYSWAPVTEVDGPDGTEDRELDADLDNWRAMNFYFAAGKKLEDYAGVQFFCKPFRYGDEFSVYLTDGNNMIGSVKRIRPMAEGSVITVMFSDLGLTHGRFTNIIFDGAGTGEREPFRFDNIYLLKRKTALPLPEAPPMTAAPGTDGWIHFEGREWKTESGETWIGNGVNFGDFKMFNACYSVPLADMLVESKRRLDFAAANGVDLIRYCIHADDGVMSARAEWWAALKDLLTWCWLKHDMRVLLSFWREGTLEGKTQAPTAASIPAWRMMTRAFAHSGHVFFGLTNEPQGWDAASQDRARQGMLACAYAIRDEESKLGAKAHVIALQGTAGWARNVEGWRGKVPADLGPIALEGHFYDKSGEFNDRFVRLSQSGVPLICGEYGPAVIQNQNDPSNYNNLNLPDSEYWSSPADVRALWTLMQENKIPSCAWAWSIRAWPDMLVDQSNSGCGRGMPLQLSAWGQLWKGLPR